MYGEVPPVTLAVAEPPVVQVADELTEMETDGALADPVIVTEEVVVQPAASVTVTLWRPAERFVAVAVVWALSQK